MSGGNIFIGSSGWYYKHWVGTFYPEKLKSGDFMDYYKSQFETVEINNSFYRLPQKKTFDQWKRQTPDNFIYSVKGSRYITHIKKLKDGRETFAPFKDRIDALENKLGPILFQLPPGWKANPERLLEFIENLPKGYKYAFEFRNHTWYTDEVFKILENYNAAFVIYELEGHIAPEKITANFAYLRLHGPDGKYQGSYPDATLKDWIAKFKNWQNNGVREVYCYFDNDQLGYAPHNAKRMKELL